jgi:hypothetical protein
MGNRSVTDHGNLDHRAPCLLEAFADRFRHLVRFAQSYTDATLLVARSYECSEREAPAAFDDLRHTIDIDDVLEKLTLASFRISPLLASLSTFPLVGH